jgi:hypothetical protein
MSAQMITALRQRAAALEAEAERFAEAEARGPTGLTASHDARWLAAEFRLLADAAENGPGE